MAAAKGLDRSSLEISVDYGRTDVRRAANCRSVSEPLGDAAARGGDDALRLGRRLRRPALGKRDGREERPAPGTKVLRAELLTHRLVDVVVEPPRRQIHE